MANHQTEQIPGQFNEISVIQKTASNAISGRNALSHADKTLIDANTTVIDMDDHAVVHSELQKYN